MEGGVDSWLLLVYGRLMSEDRGKREEVRGCLVWAETDTAEVG